MITAVDLFAGAGGFSEGARAAGVQILSAVNHWPTAVATHAINHPGTRHFCQDAALVNPWTLGHPDLLLASPACQGHSLARGVDRPHHDSCRSTAWCVVKVLEALRPRWVVVENVPEFRSRWALYPQWKAAVEGLGYRLQEQVVCASDFGVCQNRKRLFILGELKLKPLPTLMPWPLKLAASSIIDFNAGRWSQVATHSCRTLARIDRGRDQHGERFLLPYYGSAQGGRSLDRPIGTITTLPRYAVVDGDRMRMLTIDETKQFMGFRRDYTLHGNLAEQNKQLGNAVCPPVAEAIIRQLVAA